MSRVNGLVLALGLSLAGLSQAGGQIQVEDSWVRAAPTGVMAMAGYMTIYNRGNQERMLVGAQSPAFARVMLHRTVFEGDVSRMEHQHMIKIPAGATLKFEPNSYHLMMMEPKQKLQSGERVTVTLQFKNGENQEVDYEVRPVMEGVGQGSGGHNHH